MRRVVIFAVAAIAVLAIGLFAADYMLLKDAKAQDSFYVGVTYCGSSTEEAKTLIDRVKDYTNILVLQSGPLMDDTDAVNEIGDYAVAKGLRFAVFFDPSTPPQNTMWLGTAEQRWGSMFAGVYYGDELGGKMLETNVDLTDRNRVSTDDSGNLTKTIVKNTDGSLWTNDGMFYQDGKISVYSSNASSPNPNSGNGTIDVSTVITYYPNGSITVEDTFTRIIYENDSQFQTHIFPGITMHSENIGRDFYTMENGSGRISKVEPYEAVQSRNPIPNCDAAAEVFVNKNQHTLDSLVNQWQLGNRSFPIFTSDYALYWWDYQSGYDMILAQLGWNNSVTQEIGLVRGAANLQAKPWGTIITWTYKQPPYLTNGTEIYNQMCASYESGAEYVIIFNYAEDMEGPYGTLKDEHFDALQRFWNDVVQNPWVAHGGVKAEAAFVLPKNYGWGLRRVDDSVWGLWEPNATAQQAWLLLQDAVAKHGLRLDIVFDDSAYPVAGKYGQIYYWNQTS
jgi:hypothetical protein